MSMTQDVKKIYGETLCQMMQKDERIAVVDIDLMRIAGSTCIPNEFPLRYANVGIAEQNGIDVAAGMAAMGKTVFVSAFCGFLGTRGSDQLLDTVCYNELNVKVLGTYAGISSGINGGTHISVSDIAAFRSMPGMKIIEVADGAEMVWAIREAARVDGPVYIRVPKGPLHEIFSEETDFAMGKAHFLSTIPDDAAAAKRVALITSGITTNEGIGAVKALQTEGIPVTHVHMTTIKPLDEQAIIRLAQTHDVLITADNHSVLGGLGTAVCEVTAAACPVKVMRLGVEDEFCEGMTEKELLERHGISASGIAKAIRACL